MARDFAQANGQALAHGAEALSRSGRILLLVEARLDIDGGIAAEANDTTAQAACAKSAIREIEKIKKQVPIYVPDNPYLGPIKSPILTDFP